jgi:hypothetical protein
MPRKKKPAIELTTEETVKRLFPAKAVRDMKKEAHKRDDGNDSKKPKKSR